ncbi:MAG: Flp pilus assembly protein CpaB [Myxococcota bacterium]|nr:Flp pilus assembly protein CpaB [Myxococcota bacterium]
MAKNKSLRASRMGAWGFTLLTVFFALGAAFSFNAMLEGSKYDNIPLQNVLVAAKDIEKFGEITRDSVKIVRWPVSAVPVGAFSSVEEFLGPESAPIPRKSREKRFANEPILLQRLAGKESNTELATLLAPGQRAFSIEVDGRLTRSRMIYPSAYVDVLTTIRREDTRESVSRIILQRIKVIALNGSTDLNDSPEEQRGREVDIVTFGLSPEEGEMLTLASRQGQIDLMLRNTADSESVESQGTTPQKLLNVEERVSLEAPRPAPRRRRRQRSFRDTPSPPQQRNFGGGRRSQTFELQ